MITRSALLPAKQLYCDHPKVFVPQTGHAAHMFGNGPEWKLTTR